MNWYVIGKLVFSSLISINFLVGMIFRNEINFLQAILFAILLIAVIVYEKLAEIVKELRRIKSNQK